MNYLLFIAVFESGNFYKNPLVDFFFKWTYKEANFLLYYKFKKMFSNYMSQYFYVFYLMHLIFLLTNETH